jgi:GWxTD domain-containing protein
MTSDPDTMFTLPTFRCRSPRAVAALFWMFCLVPVLSVAQPGPMNFLYTYSSFAYTDSTSLVEFDCQFSDQGIVYRTEENGEVGKLLVRILVRNSNGASVLADSWMIANSRPENGAAPRALLTSRLFELHPGDYGVQIYYADAADKSNRDSAEFTMTVRDYSGTRLQLSDIQIATEINQSDEPSAQFYRNGYVVYPNVTGIISEPFLVLNTYLEVYNSDRVPTSEYNITYGIADSSRKLFYQRDEKRPRGTSKGIVEINSIIMEELPSGDYYLVVKAYNGLQNLATDSIMIFRRFSVYNPGKDSALKSLAMNNQSSATVEIDPMYAGMKEEELDVEFSKVKYIATESEKKIWTELHGPVAKGRFLTGYWKRRDPSPGTPVNESYDSYQKRLHEAEGLYRSPMTPRGWDSDRGRILLQYGKPDNQDRHFQDYNRKPFEIWTYSQYGYVFVFVDRTQTGTYPLVHSTAPGEFRFEDWMREFAMLDKHIED